jgi:hypothetical protein
MQRARKFRPDRVLNRITLSVILWIIAPFQPLVVCNAHADVTFMASTDTIDTYDFVEVTIKVDKPSADNPFTDVVVEGWFAHNGGEHVQVDGFCDSADGSTFHVRFMPKQPGGYDYRVQYRHGSEESAHNGKFVTRESRRLGLVRVDKDHPWHFVWEGTGEHYFWNGTTTY